MSTARSQILGDIRRALGRGALDATARARLEERLARPPAHLRPALPADLEAHFVSQLETAAGTLMRAATPAQAVSAITGYLTEYGLPWRLVAAAEPALQALPWPAELGLEYRPPRGQDVVAVTAAFAAVAETGSLVMLSDPLHPTSLNFLPDVHIVLLRREQIVAHLEDVWLRLRAERSPLPRAVNLITGPSRTADIEQTLQLGAHGPRRLHVILLEGDVKE